jgi:hypothetical protein
VFLLLAAAVSVTPDAFPQTPSCEWVPVAPDVVRSPVQMDIHAGYLLFVFKSDGTVGYRLRGRFPFSAFMSFTIYHEHGLLHAALLDTNINPDADSINPFRQPEPVNAENRSFEVTVLPAGSAADSMSNPIFMPPLPRGTSEAMVVLVERVYLTEPQKAEPQEYARFGGVEPPTIEPFLVSRPWIPVACPPDDFSAIINQF